MLQRCLKLRAGGRERSEYPSVDEAPTGDQAYTENRALLPLLIMAFGHGFQA
ncbi:MAG: hypothetical protein AAGG02_20025 [Cyanobacteria bacterium P01_H01_bin.15]